ncbi:sulfatase [Pseudozobellia thermophila]|uniref:Arylsulfatase A n=1 Tax=Pseudozobellia thermophila TaxID=192903 RepID=A0A1M6M9F0_9FLAO|nr:sulfatase [Pseudozobellia thermophila]SHJ79913.1 Arylsulfatase A [Pseudozobellia thermophila]
MNKCITLYLMLLALVLFSCESEEVEELPPNIVLFLVDDMGWQDTSVPFYSERTALNERYHTPNMEKLAAQGMKFTQAYATPVCSPTRVSLITGMNAARHRVTNWTLRKDSIQPMEKNHDSLQFPEWNVNGVSPVAGDPKSVQAMPLPQALNDMGYYTVHAGKAHFGAIGTPGEDPLNLGFDVNIAGHAAGAPGSYLGTENFGNGKPDREIWAVPGLEDYHGKEVFLTEALTQEALKALDSVVATQQPFFLYMAHYAVHTPIMGDARFVQKYLEKGLDSTEAKYASMIEGMDKSLGDIMKYLERKDIAGNTVILFMSDNGGLSAHARGGEPHTHNLPLSSGKGSVREGGIREPMLVKWPGKVEPASVSDYQVIIEDFYPTILEMAGIDSLDTVQKIDGQSFVPVLKGEKEYDGMRTLVWHYPNEWGPSGPGIGATSAIRKGDYKLIYYHLDQHMELFNLKEDIGETKNLVETDTIKAKELARNLSDYLKDVDAQMPILKTTGEVVPYPIELFSDGSSERE